MSQVPDPVSNPEAYRATLLAALGRGPESYEMTFRLAAGHDRVHLDRARRALSAARARAARVDQDDPIR